jgi:ABC-type nitrate/sulfonate/bicarbonate transport system substrate-binding protein
MVVSFVIILLSLFYLAPGAQAQTLKVGMTSKTLFYLPFYAAQRKGFYSAENLKTELILIGRTDV